VQRKAVAAVAAQLQHLLSKAVCSAKLFCQIENQRIEFLQGNLKTKQHCTFFLREGRLEKTSLPSLFCFFK